MSPPPGAAAASRGPRRRPGRPAEARVSDFRPRAGLPAQAALPAQAGGGRRSGCAGAAGLRRWVSAVRTDADSNKGRAEPSAADRQARGTRRQTVCATPKRRLLRKLAVFPARRALAAPLTVPGHTCFRLWHAPCPLHSLGAARTHALGLCVLGDQALGPGAGPVSLTSQPLCSCSTCGEPDLQGKDVGSNSPARLAGPGLRRGRGVRQVGPGLVPGKTRSGQTLYRCADGLKGRVRPRDRRRPMHTEG